MVGIDVGFQQLKIGMVYFVFCEECVLVCNIRLYFFDDCLCFYWCEKEMVGL